MRSYPNIEKSGFHRGEYVGYSGGRVYRISRAQLEHGTGWRAVHTNPPTPMLKMPDIRAYTLAPISERLASLPAPNYAKEA